MSYLIQVGQLLFQLNAMMLVIFYLMGQGVDTLGFLTQTLVGFSAPFGLVSIALGRALDEAEETVETPSIQIEQIESQYISVDQFKTSSMV
jgi:hypothetical protein